MYPVAASAAVIFYALSARGLGPSGGFFLVPPRKKERMRLKEALSAKPPSLRILPASETSQLSAPPSGEYGVQSLNLSWFNSLKESILGPLST